MCVVASCLFLDLRLCLGLCLFVCLPVHQFIDVDAAESLWAACSLASRQHSLCQKCSSPTMANATVGGRNPAPPLKTMWCEMDFVHPQYHALFGRWFNPFFPHPSRYIHALLGRWFPPSRYIGEKQLFEQWGLPTCIFEALQLLGTPKVVAAAEDVTAVDLCVCVCVCLNCLRVSFLQLFQKETKGKLQSHLVQKKGWDAEGICMPHALRCLVC